MNRDIGLEINIAELEDKIAGLEAQLEDREMRGVALMFLAGIVLLYAAYFGLHIEPGLFPAAFGIFWVAFAIWAYRQIQREAARKFDAIVRGE